jgi:hypothetical protein
VPDIQNLNSATPQAKDYTTMSHELLQQMVGAVNAGPVPGLGSTGTAGTAGIPGSTSAVHAPAQPLAFGVPLGFLMGDGSDQEDGIRGAGMPGESALQPGSVYVALFARGHSVLGLAGVLELITDALVMAFKEVGGHLQQRVTTVVMAACIDQQRLMQVGL